MGLWGWLVSVRLDLFSKNSDIEPTVLSFLFWPLFGVSNMGGPILLLDILGPPPLTCTRGAFIFLGNFGRGDPPTPFDILKEG